MGDLEVVIGPETLRLLPERALFWPRVRTLFIADLHVGKAAAFRASAVPIPEGSMADDLARLTRAVERTQTKTLVILGDLLHAPAGRQPAMMDAVSAWRAEHPTLRIFLVRGNHDLAAGDPPAEWRIFPVNGPTIGPYFVLNHTPITPDKGYALAGHLHPSVVLRGKGQQRLKLPCFWLMPRCAVLPAFGSFTGTSAVEPLSGDRVFAVTPKRIVALPRRD
ncbi:MAG: ligase-associated DNA damage response endonuclease PdeM [Aggregatilineales bacterium]